MTTHTCIQCAHWNPQGTDQSMLRHGHAQCLQKSLPGHTLSAEARACEKFAATDVQTEMARRAEFGKRKCAGGG